MNKETENDENRKTEPWSTGDYLCQRFLQDFQTRFIKIKSK